MVQILSQYETKFEIFHILVSGVDDFVTNLNGGRPNPVVRSRRCIVFEIRFSLEGNKFSLNGPSLPKTSRDKLENEGKHVFR